MKFRLSYILAVFAAIFLGINAAAQTYNGGTWYSLYKADEDYDVFVNTYFYETTGGFFYPTDYTFKIDYKRFSFLSTKEDIEFYIKTTGDYVKVGNVQVNSTSFSTYSGSWSTGYGNNLTGFRIYCKSTGATVKNLRFPLAKHILLDNSTAYGASSTSYSFSDEKTKIGTQHPTAYTIKLRSFLTAGNISISSNNAAFHFGGGATSKSFDVGANACASVNGSGTCSSGKLGAIGNYQITVYFTPTAEGTNSGKITISDGASTAEVDLSGVGYKYPEFYFEALSPGVTGGTATSSGKVTVEGTTYNQTSASAEVTYTASPASGYEFAGWGANAAATTYESTSNPYVSTLTNGTAYSTVSKTLYAIFKPVFKFEAKAVSSNSSFGSVSATVSPSVPGETPSSTSATAQATFAATPSPGCNFVGWYRSSDCSGSPVSTSTSYQVSLTNNTVGSTFTETLYAKFMSNQTLSWSNAITDFNIVKGAALTTNTATSSSGLAVSYESDNNSVITVDADGTLHAVEIGSATITVRQSGNGEYNAAAPISRTFSVMDKFQPVFTPSFTGTAPNMKVGTTETVTLSNQTGSFSFSNSNPDVLGCTRSGNTLTLSALKGGSATLTLTEPGDMFTYAATVTYNITVSRYANTLDVASLTKEMTVGESWSGVLMGKNSDAALEVSCTPSGIVSYDAGTNTLVALAQGVATVTFSQSPTNVYEAASRSIGVSVGKIANTLVINMPALQASVGEKLAVSFSGLNNTGVPVVGTVSNQVLSSSVNNGTDVISYADGYVTALNAGTATITFSQAETDSYMAATPKSFNIEVSKTAAVISVTIDGASRNSINLGHGSSAALSYTSTSDAAFSVTRTSGSDDIASISGGSIVSGTSDGAVIWEITQPETYRYTAGSAFIRVKVNSTAESVGYVLTHTSDLALNTIETGPSMKLDGPGDVVIFDASRAWNISGTSYLWLEYSTDGGKNFKEGYRPGLGTSMSNYSWILPEGVTHIRFKTVTGATLITHVENIYVTRKTYLEADCDKKDLGTVNTGNTATATITVDWSSTNGGDISIESSNPCYSFSPDVISDTGNADGKTEITLTYTPDPEKLGTDVVSIIVSDLFYSKTIEVTATAAKQGTAISALYDAETATSLKVDGTISNAFSFAGVSAEYPSADPSSDLYYTIDHTVSGTTEGSPNPDKVISYNPADNVITALNAGTAKLTIYQKSTNLYSATSASFEFSVSRLENEGFEVCGDFSLEIDAEQSGIFVPMEGAGPVSYEFSEETFTAPSLNREGGVAIFDVETNKVTANNGGSVRLDVTQARNYKYEAVTKSLVVTVNKIDQTMEWDRELTDYNILKGATLEGNTATASSGGAVTYSSSNPASVSVDENTGVLTAVAEGANVEITATQQGDYKYNPVSVVRKFNVFGKSSPEFTPSFQGTETVLEVDSSVSFLLTNVSDGLDGDFTVSADKDGFVVWSRNGNELTVAGLVAGEVVLTLSQKGDDDFLAKSAEYRITVSEPDDYVTIHTDKALPVEGCYRKITLNRTFTAGYSTISLPFDTNISNLISGSGVTSAKVYVLSNVGCSEGEGYYFYFNEVESGAVRAGVPYVIFLDAEVVNPVFSSKEGIEIKDIEGLAENSVINCGAWSFVSNFTPSMPMSGLYGVVNSPNGGTDSVNRIMKGGEGSFLNSCSAYFRLTPAAESDRKSVMESGDGKGHLLFMYSIGVIPVASLK